MSAEQHTLAKIERRVKKIERLAAEQQKDIETLHEILSQYERVLTGVANGTLGAEDARAAVIAGRLTLLASTHAGLDALRDIMGGALKPRAE